MALIKCPDCDTEMSDLAVACPKCGRPNAPAVAAAEKVAKTSEGSRMGSTVLGASIGLATGVVLVWKGCNRGESMSSQEMTIALFGGGLFAILGALVGSRFK